MTMSQPSARAQEQDSRIPYPTDTIFFVPDIPYEQGVIKGYINKKYSNVPKDMIVSQVNMNALPHLDIKFIVLVRKGVNGEPPGPAYHLVPDEFGKKMEKPVAPDTYHGEVYESPAIRVRDFVQMPRITMFQQVEPNLNPLIDALCDHAWPCRITPQNKPDSMLRFVVA